MRRVAFIVCVFVGALLLYASGDFPDWGDPNSPANRHISPVYIEQAYEKTDVPNLVSAILADYRNYDTMLETSVVFTAGCAVVLFLGVPLAPLARHRNPEPEKLETVTPPRDLVIEISCRILFPIIQLFALYVLAHGHHSPGGGFQAGVIMASSYILLAIAFDLKTALSKFPRQIFLTLAAVGVIIYAGVGVVCLFMGGNFFEYEALQPLLGVSAAQCHSLGILGVECGVTLTVCSVIFFLYVDLASGGRQDEGL